MYDGNSTACWQRKGVPACLAPEDKRRSTVAGNNRAQESRIIGFCLAIRRRLAVLWDHNEAPSFVRYQISHGNAVPATHKPLTFSLYFGN
jgi:hypothetical protein